MVAPIKNISMKILIIIIMSLFCNCSKDNLWKDDELSIPKTPYLGNELRMNGYFYHPYGTPEKLTIYFFYKDGTILLAGDHYEMNNRVEFEQSFTTNEFIEKRRNIKYCWGVFKIEGNNIRFERWYPSEKPYKSYIREGIIMNDTTFQINTSYRMVNGKKTELASENEIYHFRQFSPKPDSTNQYIK
jgi:hypothetical protein